MSNIYGRQVVLLLTNKSGGSVAAGDVVIIDTSNNDAFTTTTSGGYTGGVGIAQETIANNASGRVLVSGYAALVNVNASVTRGNYGKTHTVAKQATDAGASRTTGTFCQFLTGGTTPTARIYSADLAAGAGNVATDAIWDAAGDLAVGTGADAAAKLAIGSVGKILASDGTTVIWAETDPIREMFGAPDTAYEFTTSSLTGLTALGTPDAEDADTTIDQAYYIADNASSTAWCGRYQAIPSYPFTAVAKIKAFNPKANYNAVGIWLGDTTPKMTVLEVRAAARQAIHELFTNPTTFASTTATAGMSQLPMPVYIAITAASTTSVTSYVSLDGYTWERVVSATNPSMTIARVGICFKSENSGGAAAAFDYFRIWNSAKTFLTGI